MLSRSPRPSQRDGACLLRPFLKGGSFGSFRLGGPKLPPDALFVAKRLRSGAGPTRCTLTRLGDRRNLGTPPVPRWLPERDTRFELATPSLGSLCSTS
jgi:hypothetical protein